jgi:uncharacterized protein (TIGR01777 family)
VTGRIVVAGGGGLIGTAVRAAYERDGVPVVRLVRREPRAPGELRWDPATPDPGLLRGGDVVVNLAGAGIGDHRWSRRYRELIRDSRIGAARTLAVMAAGAADPPRVLLSASGIRYYGVDRGDEELTEASPPGNGGLLPSVAHAWEAATDPASDAGVPVCHLRLGLVLTRHGGLLPPLLRMFRSGVGAYFASGREFWSYLSLTDAVRAIRFLATHPGAAGPYNISTPDPLRNKEFMRVLARVTRARMLVRLPVPVLRLAMGPIAPEVLGGLRVLPARLTGAGFAFAHPGAESTLRDALAS